MADPMVTAIGEEKETMVALQVRVTGEVKAEIGVAHLVRAIGEMKVEIGVVPLVVAECRVTEAAVPVAAIPEITEVVAVAAQVEEIVATPVAVIQELRATQGHHGAVVIQEVHLLQEVETLQPALLAAVAAAAVQEDLVVNQIVVHLVVHVSKQKR